MLNPGRRPASAGRLLPPLAALLLLAVPAPGASRPPRAGGDLVSAWGIAEGLPQSTINDIAETPDGELWLATFGGLARFDGVRFEVLDLATLPGLPSNRITALVAAPEGGLWLATQTGHVVRFREGRVTEDLAVGDVLTELIALKLGGDGILWARATSGAAYRIEHGRAAPALAEGESFGFHNLAISADGAVWAGRGRQLARLDTGERFALRQRAVCVAPDPGGGLWLGLDDGLAHFADGRALRVAVSPALAGPVTAILPEGEKTLWVGSARGPVRLERQAGGGWRAAPPPFELPPTSNVREMVRDGEGSLWIGTAGQGLFRIARNPILRIGVEQGIGEVSALAADGEGGAWLTAGCGGLFRVSAAGAVAAVPLPVPPGAPLSCDSALALDRHHRLWLRGRGQLFHQQGQELRRVDLRTPLPDQPGPIAVDASGALWIVSRDGAVQRLVPGSEPELVRDLKAELVSAAVAPDGSLWVGGRGEVYHLRDRTAERFGAAENVPPGAVRDLLPDADGSLWIATYGGGLGRLRDGRVRRISSDQGLADNSISRILADASGRIWLLANRGISVVERRELAAIADGKQARLVPVELGPERGVPEGNFGSPAGFSDAAGRLWFGTLAGAVAVDSAAFPFDKVHPAIRIERVAVDGSRRPPMPRMELPPGTARVRLDYTTFARIAPERVRFRYRFEGVDPDWVDVGGQRFAVWTPAEPGLFRFLVQARNEDGVWSEHPAEILFTVLPAWWQTTLFRAALALALAGAALTAHRIRLRHVRARAHALVLESAERHKAEAHAVLLRGELEHVLRMATAGELATSLAHELNQPLAAIVSNAQAGRRRRGHPGRRRPAGTEGGRGDPAPARLPRQRRLPVHLARPQRAGP